MTFHPEMRYGEALHVSRRELRDEGDAFAFTAGNRERFERIAAHYPPEYRRSAVIPALYLVQEQQGYVNAPAIRHVADVIGCTAAEVDDVVTYYVMFFRRPVGKYVIQVCRTLSCALRGAERVTAELTRRLGVKTGETDPTGTFTVMEMECLGACDRAPVVMVNNRMWHEGQTPEGVQALLDGLREKGEGALTGCHLEVEKRADGKQQSADSGQRKVDG
ncbi:MAG: NADH-quinone oxidoreductase subunit NuoE [Acidobacteria bacterium]|nr:MAG: NADH-quinone oxidoreductase subunit NuoE [Acidobacteriota bacterium]